MTQSLRMREYPATERPYEKAKQYGVEALTDAELLAIMIRTGTKNTGCLSLCYELLEALGGSLSGLSHCTIEQLTGISGIGEVKALQLKCIVELARRIWKERPESALVLSSPKAVFLHYREDFRHLQQEIVSLLLLDTKCHLIRCQELSRGTINASLISPREVFIAALKCNAVNMILLHNHPSGDPTPSSEDFAITKQIRDLGKIMQLPLMDHIILGDNRYTSLKEAGYL